MVPTRRAAPGRGELPEETDREAQGNKTNEGKREQQGGCVEPPPSRNHTSGERETTCAHKADLCLESAYGERETTCGHIADLCLERASRVFWRMQDAAGCKIKLTNFTFGARPVWKRGPDTMGAEVTDYFHPAPV